MPIFEAPTAPAPVLGAGPASALPEGEDAVSARRVAHHAEELSPAQSPGVPWGAPKNGINGVPYGDPNMRKRL